MITMSEIAKKQSLYLTETTMLELKAIAFRELGNDSIAAFMKHVVAQDKKMNPEFYVDKTPAIIEQRVEEKKNE